MSIFMQVPNITGESSDSNHKGWIDLVKMSFNVQRQITSNTSTRGDRESSNAEAGELEILKFMDKSTPSLFLNSCCGTGKDIIIELTKTGSGQGADVYMQYTLRHAIFSSYHVRQKNKNKHRPVEFLTISYTKLEKKYISYDENNNPQAPTVVGFDMAQNIKL